MPDWYGIEGIKGSSPLTRGKRVNPALRMPTVGLIPAHAGKTCRPWTLRSAPGAHPRSRGENADCAYTVCITEGSSPLTRGKHVCAHHERVRGRLIPAHAGKTHGLILGCTAGQAHPRSRGENRASALTVSCHVGSSPLTRGKHGEGVAFVFLSRLIPAHAGKTRTAWLRSWACPAHPRSRGENSEPDSTLHPVLGSSPLTRGKRWRSHWKTLAGRLIPAHAGKT